MSTTPSGGPQLLCADEQQLERAGKVLAGGGEAFVVIVCEAALREQAMAVLRKSAGSVEVPSPEEVRQPEEVLGALERPADGAGVRSLAMTVHLDGVLEALNWHREKLLSGAPVVLWLEDVEALRKLRELAPDAYAFRETVVLVRGDGGPLPVPSSDETERVAQARRQLRRARTPLQRAAASLNLANGLRVRARLAEAEEAARSALLALPPAAGENEQDLRARLCRALAAAGRDAGEVAQELYWIRRGLAELDLMPFARSLPWRAEFLAGFPGPFDGLDHSKTVEAQRLVRTYGIDPEATSTVLNFACGAMRAVGDLKRARALSEEYRDIKPRSEFNVALGGLNEGASEAAVGNFSLAEVRYREAMVVASSAGGYLTAAALELVNCAIWAGELEAAERRVAEGLEQAAADVPISLYMRAWLAMARGDVEACLEILRQVSVAARARNQDGHLLHVCGALIDVTVSMREAERLNERVLADILIESDAVRDAVQVIAGADGPPWYPIRFLTLRARLLAITPGMLDQAADSSAQALDKARAIYPELVPECGRLLSEHLIQAGRPDNALATLDSIEKDAESRGFLKELARIRAARIRALVLKGEAPAVITPHVAALRESLAATGSPRITAETLRDLALNLPPCSATPDPLSLTEEAHGLFVSMPMPAEESRCLEAMGDILLARGRAAEAKRRYVAARARLERHRLGLRLPLLSRKIDALG
ncbi:hypothetical protein WME99_33730 [Sorangium sp. So ce136]|uniref:hypothetical protein n=1 Tax=Sorangium sp. So ce136 TaxID=3133284 RepID=UPI003F020B02